MLTKNEIKYLKSNKLAKLYSVSDKHRSKPKAVSYEIEGEDFLIPSVDAEKTLNYKIINKGKEKVALDIDDVRSFNPYKKRGIKVDGTAEMVEREGELGPKLYIRVTPKKTRSWGINK